MKLVSKTNFFNPKYLNITVDKKSPGFQHEDVIHKGARFEIGKAEFFKDLTTSEKEIVGALVRYNQVVFDDKENNGNGVIAQIDKEVAAEVAAEKKRAEATAKKVE